MTQEEADKKILEIISVGAEETNRIMEEKRKQGIKRWGLDGEPDEDCAEVERIAKEKIKKILEQIDE